MGRRIILVACCSTKLDHPAQARDLYCSPLFKKMREYAERNSDRWFILSAVHGVVKPTDKLAPYNTTLNTMCKQSRGFWRNMVTHQLADVLRLDDTVTILAGARYVEGALYGVHHYSRSNVVLPLQGLGIGQQLKWLKDHLENSA